MCSWTTVYIVQYTATKTGGFSHIHFQNGGSVMRKGFLIFYCIRKFFVHIGGNERKNRFGICVS
jgi:hypothetical protein